MPKPDPIMTLNNALVIKEIKEDIKIYHEEEVYDDDTYRNYTQRWVEHQTNTSYSQEYMNIDIHILDYDEGTIVNFIRGIADLPKEEIQSLSNKYKHIDTSSEDISKFLNEMKKNILFSEAFRRLTGKKGAGALDLFVYKLIDDTASGKLERDKEPLSKDELKRIVANDLDTVDGIIANRGLKAIRSALAQKYNHRLYSYESRKEKLNSRKYAGECMEKMSAAAKKKAEQDKADARKKYEEEIRALDEEEAAEQKKQAGILTEKCKNEYAERRKEIRKKYAEAMNSAAGRIANAGDPEPQDDKDHVYVQIDQDSADKIDKINRYEYKEEPERKGLKDAEDLNAERKMAEFEKEFGLDRLSDEEKYLINLAAGDINVNKRTFRGKEKADSEEFASIKNALTVITQYMKKDIVDGKAAPEDNQVSFDDFEKALNTLEENAKNYIKTRKGWSIGDHYDWKNMSTEDYLKVNAGFKWSDSGTERFELAKNALLLKQTLSDRLGLLKTKVTAQNEINNKALEENKEKELKDVQTELAQKLREDLEHVHKIVKGNFDDKRYQKGRDLKNKFDFIDMFLVNELDAVPQKFEEQLKKANDRMDKENQKMAEAVAKINEISDEDIKKFAIKAIDKFDIKIPRWDYTRATALYGSKDFIARVIVGAVEGKSDEIIDENDPDKRKFSNYFDAPKPVKEQDKAEEVKEASQKAETIKTEGNQRIL